LMRVRVRVLLIIARRVCLLMRGVVRMGLISMYSFHFFVPQCKAVGNDLTGHYCYENS
jgi:hypothetical protein